MADYVYAANKANLDLGLVVKELSQQALRLLDDLELEYQKQLATGITEIAAKTIIRNQVLNETGIYKTWQNGQKSRIRKLENELVAKPTQDYVKSNPNQKYDWVRSAVESCGDCLRASSMEPRTIREWRQLGFGLPREGNTACNVGCKCILVPLE